METKEVSKKSKIITDGNKEIKIELKELEIRVGSKPLSKYKLFYLYTCSKNGVPDVIRIIGRDKSIPYACRLALSIESATIKENSIKLASFEWEKDKVKKIGTQLTIELVKSG